MNAQVRPLPCPFCGWAEPKVLRVESDADFSDDFSVHCLECGSLGANKDTEADAIEAWNMRVELRIEPKPDSPEEAGQDDGQGIEVTP